MQINFTKSKIDNIQIPDNGKRINYKDEKEKGLVLRVSPSGSKIFYLYKKFEGRPLKIKLGCYPDIGVEMARQFAQIEKVNLLNGVNKNIEKKKLSAETTFIELFDNYMENYSKLEKKSWKYDIYEVNKYLTHFFNRKISKIHRTEIIELHNNTRKNNGLYQANRILERVRAIYNKAIEWGYEGLNPTMGIKKFKEKKRDRFLLPEEMPYFFNALEHEHNKKVVDFIYMALFTGARKTNILQMKWCDIDYFQNIWKIQDTKNGEPMLVPLSKYAMDILIKRQGNNSMYVFEGDGSGGYLADPKKSWDRIRKNATVQIWKNNPFMNGIIRQIENKLTVDNNGVYRVVEPWELYNLTVEYLNKNNIEPNGGIMDVRIHDLRRTFGSYQAITGSSLAIIGKSLGHKSMQSTEIYARLNQQPVRESIEMAINKIMEYKENYNTLVSKS